MQSLIFVVVALCLIFVAPSSVFAQTDSKKSKAAKPAPVDRTEEVRKEIQDIINKSDEAFVKKDIKGMFAMIAPDFVSVSENGEKTTGAKFRETYERMLPLFSSIESVTSVESVTVKGETATVIVSTHTRTQGTREDDKQLDVTADGQERQFWTKKSGKWQVKQARTLTHTTTVNGRVLPK